MSEKIVAVTGASGFVASHLVAQLLAKKYRIRGSVRDTRKSAELAFLADMDPDKLLSLHSADLNQPDSFEETFRGAETVFHTASPYALTVKDAQKDLVTPAEMGTLNVLKQAAKTNTVKRVVLTSSMAAITDEPDGRVLTEDDWNERSTLRRNPYYFSKVRAERAAWEFMREQTPSFDLVVINPFLVIGPSFTKALNPSNGVIADLTKGLFPGIVNLTWGLVDVRDVARAHILVAETPAASGRYICAAETRSMRQIVDVLKQSGVHPKRLPRMRLDHAFGNSLVWLASFFQPAGAGTYVRTHIGRVPRFSHQKLLDLGFAFRSVDDSLVETIADLKRWGHLEP